MRWMNEEETRIIRSFTEVKEGILLKIIIHKIEIFCAILGSLILYWKKEDLREEERFLLKIFALVSFQFFVFYIFINESPLERDFLPFRLFCLLIIFSSFNRIKFKNSSIVVLSLFSYMLFLVNANNHFSEYDEIEAERQRDLDRLIRVLGEIPHQTRYFDGAPQIYFSHPLFGLVKKESKRVSKIEEANIYVEPDLLLCFIPTENICQQAPNNANDLRVDEFKLFIEDTDFKIYMKEQTDPV